MNSRQDDEPANLLSFIAALVVGLVALLVLRWLDLAALLVLRWLGVLP